MTDTDPVTLDDLYELYAAPGTGGTWLRSVFVSTLDGSSVDRDGVSASLGGDADSAVFSVLRNLADVVLVGAGTARDEGYGPLSPDDVDAARRADLGLSPTPVLALVSHSLDVPESLQTTGTLVVTTVSAVRERQNRLSSEVEVLAHGDTDIDWPSVLADLADRGLRRVSSEGGPRLHGALLEADVVDELCLTVDPSLVAGAGTRIAVSDAAVDRPMSLVHAYPVGDVLLLRYYRRR